jgi:hypothetical protein
MNATNIYRAWVLLPALLLGLALSSSTGFCQSKADWSLLSKFTVTFPEHARDFLEFQKAFLRNDAEYAVTTSFADIASSYAATSDFISEEVFIMLKLETETDKQIVRDLLQRRIQTTIKDINTTTTTLINLSLSSTKQPAIVAEGNKLKDDLREFRKALEAISDKAAEGGTLSRQKNP